MLKRFVVLALILTMVLSACTPVQRSAAPQETGGGEDAAAGARTYVLVPKNLGNPYFDAANKGAQEAAGELGLTVLYQGSSTADATEQIQLINALIAQEVSGLAISANDADALVPHRVHDLPAGGFGVAQLLHAVGERRGDLCRAAKLRHALYQ